MSPAHNIKHEESSTDVRTPYAGGVLQAGSQYVRYSSTKNAVTHTNATRCDRLKYLPRRSAALLLPVEPERQLRRPRPPLPKRDPQDPSRRARQDATCQPTLRHLHPLSCSPSRLLLLLRTPSLRQPLNVGRSPPRSKGAGAPAGRAGFDRAPLLYLFR